MASPRSIEGRRVLITGAARGIGAEAARRIAAAGGRVALVGLEPELLEQTAARCGADAIWREADVSDAGSIATAVDSTAKTFGGIDAVVTNAGVAGAGTVRTIDPSAFDRTIEIERVGASEASMSDRTRELESTRR
ncbi:MAG: SDR family NAD(P)-dependent oxidoreductase [Solirubrobacterales bacterium]